MRLSKVSRVLATLSAMVMGGVALSACGSPATTTFTEQSVAAHCSTTLAIDTARLQVVGDMNQRDQFFVAFAGTNKIVDCTGHRTSKGYVLGGVSSNNSISKCLAGALMALCLRNGDQKVESWMLALSKDIVRIRAVDSTGTLPVTRVVRDWGGILSPAGASGIEVTGFDAGGRVVDSISLMPR